MGRRKGRARRRFKGIEAGFLGGMDGSIAFHEGTLLKGGQHRLAQVGKLGNSFHRPRNGFGGGVNEVGERKIVEIIDKTIHIWRRKG